MSDLAERMAAMEAKEQRQDEMLKCIKALFEARTFGGFPNEFDCLRHVDWLKGSPPSELHLRALSDNIEHYNLEPIRLGECEDKVGDYEISIIWAECKKAAA